MQILLHSEGENISQRRKVITKHITEKKIIRKGEIKEISLS